jgi:hypothetical protein
MRFALGFVRCILPFFLSLRLVSFSSFSSFSFPSLPLSHRPVDDQFCGFPLFLLFRLRFGGLHRSVTFSLLSWFWSCVEFNFSLRFQPLLFDLDSCVLIIVFSPIVIFPAF